MRVVAAFFTASPRVLRDATGLLPVGRMVYSTYFGGSTWEYPMGGAAIDSSGNVWLTGYTESQDLPLKTS
jgi:hypothetical protein